MTKYVVSRLRCPSCGTVSPIPRKKNQLRPLGHLKDIYCWVCRSTTKHVEEEA